MTRLGETGVAAEKNDAHSIVQREGLREYNKASQHASSIIDRIVTMKEIRKRRCAEKDFFVHEILLLYVGMINFCTSR